MVEQSRPEWQLEQQKLIEQSARNPEFYISPVGHLIHTLENLHLPKPIYRRLYENGIPGIEVLEQDLEDKVHLRKWLKRSFFRGIGPRQLEVIKHSLDYWKKTRATIKPPEYGDY